MFISSRFCACGVKIWLKIALYAVRLPKFEPVNGKSRSPRKMVVKDLRQRSMLTWFCACAESCACVLYSLAQGHTLFCFRLSVSQSVFVNRSVVERLRPQFFTDFHEILHAAQKCGRIVAGCLWEKLEVVCRNRNRISEMCKFRIWFRLVHCQRITSVTRDVLRQILHADQKCDGFYLPCFGNHKPEVDMPF